MEADFTRLLLGKDLRKLKHSSKVIEAVNDQKSFDELFRLVFYQDRPLAMRAADAVEKVTANNPSYLKPHKAQLLSALKHAEHKELKWHIAQLIARIDLDKKELTEVMQILTCWARNKNESKLVRVNSLQGLFDIAQAHHEWKNNVLETLAHMQHERVPSIQARIRKLKKAK
ncbi:MAG TPA: hypothetical protein VF141_18385 [Chryseolinea sp.]